jgi:hypothetical protein
MATVRIQSVGIQRDLLEVQFAKALPRHECKAQR